MSIRKPLRITCTAQGGVAQIALSGHIYSESSNASSAALNKQLKAISKNTTKAVVRIHTPGGDVFEATEIYNLIDDAFEEVSIVAGALVASAGTYFLTKWPSTAKANSMFMIHKPSGGAWGNEDDLESRLGLLKTLTADYRASYASKMGITEDEVDALWEKGDHWLTAKEALKAGLIDKIEDKKAVITPESYLDLVACGCPSAEKYKPQTTDEMKVEQIAAQLGLPASATEADVTAKIEALKQDAAALTSIKAEQSAAQEASQKANIKALLDTAEQNKQITAAQRPHYQQLAEANFESCKAIIEELPKAGAGLSGALQPPSAGDAEKTFEYYQQHPKEWQALEANDPEKAKALAEAHYQQTN